MKIPKRRWLGGFARSVSRSCVQAGKCTSHAAQRLNVLQLVALSSALTLLILSLVGNATAPVDLTVRSMNDTLSVRQGQAVGTAILVWTPESKPRNVTLHAQGQPTGSILMFGDAYRSNGHSLTPLFLYVPDSVAAGQYAVTIAADSSGLPKHTTTFRLIVHAGPAPVAGIPGSLVYKFHYRRGA